MFLSIAKTIFAYSSYLSKLSGKIQQQLMNSINIFKNKTYNELNQNQKQQLNDLIQHKIDTIQQLIDSITDDINQKTFIVSNYLQGTYIPDQDNEKFQEILGLFHTYKKKKQMVKKDIRQYKNYSQLYNAIQPFLKMQDVFEYANQYCQKIVSVGSFSCYKVEKFEDGRILFYQSGWCVKGRGYFEQYGAPYYLVFNGNKRYALIHLDSQQCKDMSDNAIDPGSANQNFFKLLINLFNQQNDGKIIYTEDFENYIPYYIQYAMDYIEDPTQIIVEFLDDTSSDMEKIDNFLFSLPKQKMIQLLNNEEILKELQYAIQYIDRNLEERDKSYESVIATLLDNGIKIGYPYNILYGICEQDDLDRWKEYWQLAEVDNIPMDYQEMVMSTSEIFLYELENGFKLTAYDIYQDNNKQNVKNILNIYFVDSITDEQSAKQFFDLFTIDSKDDLKDIFNYIIEQLSLSDKQIELIEEECKKRKWKMEFDQYPSLPGLE